MEFLMVVLDGMSYVFANVFCWWNRDLLALWRLKARRHLLYVDVIPETPSVATAFFQLRRYVTNKVFSNYIWDFLRNKKVVALNIPVSMPPTYIGVPRPKNWVDYIVLPEDSFTEKLMEYHEFVKKALASADIGFVWYMVPDQAHHYFFPTIHDNASLSRAIKWYGMASRLALDLLNTFKPKKYAILSDHGFTADRPDTNIHGRYHIRDAMIIANTSRTPLKVSEVIYWLVETLGIT